MSDSDYENYKERMDATIRDTLDDLQCQPILFVGSGFTRRYFGAPSWIELLQKISSKISINRDEFNYICQKYNNNAIDIGSDLESRVFEWAWGEGKDFFPK
jgi:hypothetical protein